MQQLSKYLNLPSNNNRTYNNDLQDYMFSKEVIENLVRQFETAQLQRQEQNCKQPIKQQKTETQQKTENQQKL